MAIPKKIVKIVRERDAHCWHCGTDDDTLVPHHRISRGMGGSKYLDRPDNLIMVCSRWNGDMEADWRVARDARGWGHKLAVWESLDRPVFDVCGGWWILLPDGSKVEFSIIDKPF